MDLDYKFQYNSMISSILYTQNYEEVDMIYFKYIILFVRYIINISNNYLYMYK